MSFFQNVFPLEFRGDLMLGDHQYSPTFKLKPNAGRSDEDVLAWNAGPYNLAGNDADGNSRANLTLGFAIDPNFRNWAYFSVNITSGAVSTSAVTVYEIVAALNAHATFSERFVARVTENTRVRVSLKSTYTGKLKYYVVNGTAEEALGFNARAGVAELPSFFARHTIANRFNYTDSLGLLIYLNPATATHAALINNAVDAGGNSLGYASGSVKADWQLMRGMSSVFKFKKQTVDGSNRLTEVIEYTAGAIAGDLARKIAYTYTSSNTVPTTVTEIPYVLTGSDLITP